MKCTVVSDIYEHFKLPNMVDVLLHWPALHPVFSYWDGQNGIWIVRSVKTDSGRWMLVVAVMSVDAYPFVYLVAYQTEFQKKSWTNS